jgi:chorismate mutase
LGNYQIVTEAGAGVDKSRPVDLLLRQVQDELRHLLAERSEVIRRIGTAKKTLVGLAMLVGDRELAAELFDSTVGVPTTRQTGITRACRVILMRAASPLTVTQMFEEVQKAYPNLLAKHKDPKASLTTILNRLADYGEVERKVAHNTRTWQWLAEPIEAKPAEGAPPAPTDEG